MPQEKKSIQSLFLDACKRTDITTITWDDSFRDNHPMLGYKIPNLGLARLYKTRDPGIKKTVLILCTAFGNIYMVQRDEDRAMRAGIKVYIPERLYKQEYYMARKFLFPDGELLLEAGELQRILGDEGKQNNLCHQMLVFLRLLEDCNV